MTDKILIGCELSGVAREAFRMLGHDAWSCDVEPSDDDSPHHIQGDLLAQLREPNQWDLLIAHPPCTYITCSAEWAYKDEPREGYHQKVKPGTLTGHARRLARNDAVEFFMKIANAPIDRIVIENPVGVMSSRWRKADQYIHPYQFGDDASKRTGLWLKNVKPLTIDPSIRVDGRIVNGVERWANQTDSGQNRLGPSSKRAKVRSKTYKGIALSMAEQWG